jgi:4-hydroxybenzoate polyprenyltransferase
MGVAMAGMLSPWGDPVPAWTGAVGFTVLGAGFAATALRGDRSSGTAPHLAISSAATALMYLTHGHHVGPPGASGSGLHAGHGGAGAPSLIVLPLALVLAGYFVWHAWACVDRAVDKAPDRARAATTSPRTVVTRTRLATRMEPVAHGVMSALMATMFLGAV